MTWLTMVIPTLVRGEKLCKIGSLLWAGLQLNFMNSLNVTCLHFTQKEAVWRGAVAGVVSALQCPSCEYNRVPNCQHGSFPPGIFSGWGRVPDDTWRSKEVTPWEQSSTNNEQTLRIPNPRRRQPKFSADFQRSPWNWALCCPWW